MVSGLTADSIVALLPDFISSTGIQVQYTICENHYALYDSIMAGMQNPDQLFDVIMMDYLWKKELVQAGCLKDIRPMIDNFEDNFTDHFIKPIRHTFVDQSGAIYALPVAAGSQMLLYRRDLFEDPSLKRSFFAATGIELREPATWSEFNAIARFFTREFNPSSPVEYGTCLMGYNPHGLVEEFLPRLWANNGSLYAKGKIQLNTSKAKRALSNPVSYTHLDVYKRQTGR